MDEGHDLDVGTRDVAATAWAPDEWHAGPQRGSARAWATAHPRSVGYSIVAMLAVVGVVLAVVALLGSPGPAGKVPPNQAGYLWCCSARDVSAQWVVPQLVHPASVGAEAVWIGAQTEDGGFFLQVGTNEFVSPLTSEYEAFWSDGPLKGMPRNLGALAPGDVVRARLERGARGWRVTFADQTQGWSRTVRLGYHVDDGNALAEWIEEDPVSVDPVRGSSLFRMAATKGTRFVDLLVNGAPPAASVTTPETFTDGSGTTFSPTSLADDSFSFHPW